MGEGFVEFYGAEGWGGVVFGLSCQFGIVVFYYFAV